MSHRSLVGCFNRWLGGGWEAGNLISTILLSIAITFYLWRSRAILILLRLWAEMKEDVATFVQRRLQSDFDELPPSTVAIPVTDLGTLKTSAKALITEVELLKTSTTAMQTDKDILQTSANAQ